MLHYTTKVKEARSLIKATEFIDVSKGDHLPLQIHVVTSYKHFGGIVKCNGDVFEEVSVRVGSCKTAEKKLGKNKF